MRQYEIFELKWKAGEPKQDWINVGLEAVFNKDGKQMSVKGFYAGNGEYRLRFMPLEEGKYECTVTGCLPAEGCEKNRTEFVEHYAFTAEAAADEKHGPVRTKETRFMYADGTHYLPFGTTVYALLHQGRKLLEETMKTLERAPFNKVRLCLFPKYFDFNRNEPEQFAFEKEGEEWNTKKPCMAYWEFLDETITRLESLEIQADLILFHPYDKWGFAALDKQQRLDYLEYVCRRLSAHPNIWWSLANEYDQLDNISKEEWLEMSAFLAQNDLNRHLISNHNFVTPWDFSDLNTTHVCLQESDTAKIPGLLKKYGKPVLYDEMGYEGNIPYSWGNLSAFEMVNRFWKAVTLGGFATHGETYMEKMDDSQVLWWSKGGTLKGKSAKRIAFLKELLCEMPGDMVLFKKEGMELESQEQLRVLIDARMPGIWDNPVLRCMAKMNDNEFTHMQQFFQQPILHCGEEAYLTYLGDACTIYTVLELPRDKNYRVEIIDVWEMTRTVVAGQASGRVEVELPGKAGMAVLAMAN